MDLLITDGRKCGHDHIEAVKPCPALDEMESSRTDQGEQQQSRTDQSEVTEGFHELSRWLLVAGLLRTQILQFSSRLEKSI